MAGTQRAATAACPSVLLLTLRCPRFSALQGLASVAVQFSDSLFRLLGGLL